MGDIQSGRQPVVVLVEAGQGFSFNTNGRPSGNIALGNQLIHNVFHCGTGNGKANAFHTGRIRKGADFHGIDADDLTVTIDQRTAGVAGIQGGIGLDQGHGPTVHVHIPVDGGNDAVGIGAPVLHAQRISDGSHGVADPQLGGIPEPGRNQILGLHLKHCQVGNLVTGDQIRRENPVIGQQNINGTSPLHHMGVGDNIAICRKNDTGSRRGGVIAGAADGNHGANVLQVNLLKRQTALHGNIFLTLGALLQLHGTVVRSFFQRRCLGNFHFHSFRGNRGFRYKGNGELRFLFLQLQFLEQPDIQNTQDSDDAKEENHQNQHQRHDTAALLGRLRIAGAVILVIPVVFIFVFVIIAIVHRGNLVGKFQMVADKASPGGKLSPP